MGMAIFCTSLATFNAGVTGVTKSCDINQIPEKVTRAMLPISIILPEAGGNGEFKTLAMLGNSPQDKFDILNIILHSETANLKASLALPKLVTLRDNLIAAAKANPLLTFANSPTQQWVSHFTWAITTGTWAGIEYNVLEVRYKVVLNI